ncbi:hypothetical protein C0995_004368 [Termitomyces sp. Mi166|nr:hypothetical protein C0995_004368 [Termitomyces sp. Mi166\
MPTSSPSAQVGRYGTISLMKRQEPNVPLTSFGIDTPELTFGRDPSCGVRLYYTEIAVVHSKILFDEDRKAFMCVLGENGVMVDGCFVKGGGEMVPLMNGSEFEIRGKRFRFTYPPKEMRAALYASPVQSTATRTPRLSLITSTQVFSPRPSLDPRENLRILKSPLKNAFKPLNRGTTPLRALFANTSSKYAYNSPVKHTTAPPPAEEEDEEEDNIVLVDGNHPRVVEDEKDLVILEDIDRPIPPSSGSTYANPQEQTFLHAPQPRTTQQEPPRTPVRRRSQSLHRAVLIRSVQRAVLKAERDEKEREEEMEEMEVLDVVAGLNGKDDDGKEGHGEKWEHEHEQGDYADMDVDMDVDMEEPLADGSDDEHEDKKKQEPKQKLTWRKSFERLWPFRSSSPTKDEDHSDDEDEARNENENDNPVPRSSSPTPPDDDEEDENEHPAPLFAPPRTPLRPQLHKNKTFGPFMTPQVQPRMGTSVSDPTIQRTQEQADVGGARGAGRFSLGGGEARRVVADTQVWRVRDIVVPPPSPAVGAGGGTRDAFVSPTRPVASPRKTVVGEEERKAIQERRRSALRQPSGLGFVPGFSPMKSKPLVFSGGPGTGSGPSGRPNSPTKSSAPPTLPNLPVGEKEEEEEDTRRLLERMKETVEGMKRRRSEVPPLPVQVPVTPRRETHMEMGRGRSPAKKREVFSLLRTESEKIVKKEVEEDVEAEMKEVEVPGPREEEEEKMESLGSAPGQETEDVGIDDVPTPMDQDEELAREKPRSRSKSRSPASVTVRTEMDFMSEEPVREKPRSRSKVKSPAPDRGWDEAKTEVREAQPKPRSKSKARSPAPVSVQEAEAMEPAREKSRSRSKAKSPAPVRVQDEELVDVAMEEQPGTGEPERQPEVNDVPEPAEEPEPVKPSSKPRSRSKSTLRAPVSGRRTLRTSPTPTFEPKELVETKARGRKATTSTPTVEETPQLEKAPVKRGRKATTTTSVPPTSSTSTQGEPAPTSRGRKPTVEPEDNEAPKRGRKWGVTTAATNATEAEAPKRGVRKTPASAPAPVVDNEKEPVKRRRAPRAGSVVPTSKPTSKTTGTVEVGEVASEEGEKKVTVKGRKRAGTIKKEDDAESVSGESVNAPTTTTNVTKARTTTVRRTRQTPASAPAVPAQEVNKENENGEEEGVKVRVSRKGRGKKNALVQEDDEVEIEAGTKEMSQPKRFIPPFYDLFVIVILATKAAINPARTSFLRYRYPESSPLK